MDDISMKDLPEHQTVADYHAHGYEAYIATLTEKGRKCAAEICVPGKAVQNSICLACVDSGRSLKECLRADIPGRCGGNLSRHFNRHKEDGQIDQFGNRRMTRIVELKGKTLGPSKENVVSTNADGEMIATSSIGIKSELQAAVVRWLHDNGLPFSSVAIPSFRNMLHVARQVGSSSETDLKLDPATMKKESALLLQRERRSLEADLAKFDTPRCHLVFDGWENLGEKYLSIAVAFIEVLPDTLKFRIEPIALKRLHVEFESSQIDKQIARTVKSVIFNIQKMRAGVLASIKSNNAENNLSSLVLTYDVSTTSENNPGYVAFTRQYAKFFDDSDSHKLQGCIGHSLALAAVYALGLKKSASQNPAMPAPPQRIVDVLDRCRRQAMCLRSPRSMSACKQLMRKYASGQFTLSKPYLENDTHWWTSSKMMESTIRNKWLVEALDEPDFALVMDDFVILQEIHAILYPLSEVCLKLEHLTNRPIGPATLPLIYFTLTRYGVDLKSGLFATDLGLSPDYLKTTFDVLQCDGSWMSRDLSTFRPATQQFFVGFVKNLLTRLHTQRGNKCFYEIIGMMVDPVWKRFARFILSRDEDTTLKCDAYMWQHYSMLHQVHRSMKWLGERNQPAKEASQRPPSSCPEDVILPNKRLRLSASTAGIITAEQEYNSFMLENPSALVQFTGKDFGLEEFTKLLSEYDPLAYWTAAKRELFPRVFSLNLATLPYFASSAYMERVVSCAKRVLRNAHSRLSDDTVENSVLLHFLAKAKDQRGWETTEDEECSDEECDEDECSVDEECSDGECDEDEYSVDEYSSDGECDEDECSVDEYSSDGECDEDECSVDEDYSVEECHEGMSNASRVNILT